ncbi:MAG: UDP-3-O-acyl-N-acetylglucosamine deacetylase [Rhodospirillales bacterium]|jgi:UDP-3-O-[3-hydroxymyristoyl] N-acetylglucosamine deacetylase|nr:UDP-3-O-acyl-N-acetylglucosamine deacetylase [Rhodospirillales bacterium]
MDAIEHLHPDNSLLKQRTLKSAIDCKGVALHSGNKVTMTLHPADANSGITFRRTDVAGLGAEIPALWDNVVDTRLCTVIGNDEGVKVSTVEHVMAALSGCGIDNALIEINGPEVPIMDGSADPFVFLIECAGIQEQDAPRRVIRVLKPVSVTEGDCTASLAPATHFSVDMAIVYDSAVVGHQNIKLGVINGAFSNELAKARTFGFLHEVEAMRAAGLARGGSLENAIVISGDDVLNEDGLRFDDEFVRHKALDAVGDMYLAGGLVIGAFSGDRSGHALNNTLLRALFADESAWCYGTISAKDAETMPNGGLHSEIQAQHSDLVFAVNG